ncbi:ROK family protein [Mesorhizobium sp. BHbdii]
MTDRSERVLAVDIGGTKIAFAEVAGAKLRNRRQIPTPRSGGDALVEAIAAEIRGARPSRLAVATTGIVSDAGTLCALNPRTLPIENGYPLAPRLQASIGVRPLVVNDAQAAAWGEYAFGAGQGARNFMFVTISTGVGGGLVLAGRLQSGQAGLAGHIGHMSVSGADAPCGCGRRGCLETVASGTAIAARFGERVGRIVTTKDVFAEAAAGNAEAEVILEDAAAALAETFANLVAATDLDRIALGGGVGLASGVLDRVLRHADSLPAAFRRQIVQARAGADAGLIGVADLAMKKNFIM